MTDAEVIFDALTVIDIDLEAAAFRTMYTQQEVMDLLLDLRNHLSTRSAYSNRSRDDN